MGELLENQYRIGLVRMERAIKERMSLQEIETLMPHDLINAKPVTAVIKEFFGSSQLSQFMDQTNPLSEVTHKRRLSALGPGGLTRERAGFEVRDVHPTHYGRICPIETPEGPNIGLIASLSTFARVNEFGFVETPYRKVEGGAVTGETAFYSALEEEKHTIAQANAEFDKKGKFINELVSSRRGGEFVQAKPEDVDLMDVSPNQLVSVAASLIPFLENDDANRALMGSNMQRQAVPLLRTQSPLVGTGMEAVVARDSGVTCVARRDGIVEAVDASRIVVKADVGNVSDVASEVDIYNLLKYQRSNQNTCLNQKPIVKKGDRVRKGDVIADGPATETGELALGANVVVAFMPWQGYNFEDSILLSERLLKDDIFTSIHIEEFECIARDTKLGKEEITRDIPNVGEEALKDLDESGIIRIGAEVKPGDVLVGKITPKGETQLSPEEKLLRAIFGEKAGDVRDSSLRVPPGVTGTIIGAKVFSRKGVEKDERAKQIESADEAKLLKDQNDEIKVIQDSAFARLRKMLTGKEVEGRLIDDKGKVLLKKGDVLDDALLSTVPYRYWAEISVGEPLDSEGPRHPPQPRGAEGGGEARLRGEDRPHQEGRRASAGRHQDGQGVRGHQAQARGGRQDGRPPREQGRGQPRPPRGGHAVPRGRPSGGHRAQPARRAEPDEHRADPRDPPGLGGPRRGRAAAEVHRGEVERRAAEEGAEDHLRRQGLRRVHRRAARQGGRHPLPAAAARASTWPPRCSTARGRTRSTRCSTRRTLPRSGQMVLFDGRTGEPFDQNVTVGVMYMLKLHHLVDEKIHARSIGPYSLVTQQPLGGKAQFGGQRLGEMEVWAMEAYGAAYTLQEFLTVKSDDVVGRTRMYEAIVKGDNVLESGLPESFNVLLKELQSLAHGRGAARDRSARAAAVARRRVRRRAQEDRDRRVTCRRPAARGAPPTSDSSGRQTAHRATPART